MPKPVKKRRPSSDPNLSAADMVRRSLEAHDTPVPAIAPVKSFKDELSAYMAKLGKKGGKASGAKRMENLSDEKRSEIALKAARARWAKAKRAK